MSPIAHMDASDQALVALGEELRRRQYRFTTITPASHRCVNSRTGSSKVPALQRVFGWSQSFTSDDLPAVMLELLEAAGALEEREDGLRSAVRFSTLGEQLFVHSAFPTEAPDSVFFGPDTYRFARVLQQNARRSPAPTTIIDLGCGSGAGGLHAAKLLAGARCEVILVDINPKAVRYSRINARLNAVDNVRTVLSDLFGQVNDGGDLIISNPPYLVDRAARLYRHGGGAFGFDLSLRIVEESLDRLYPGGRLVLYTGTPVIGGEDGFFEAVRPRLEARRCRYSYEEIDPDVFGEELQAAPYDRVDRIAAVALTVDVEQDA